MYCPAYQKVVDGACIAEICTPLFRLRWDGACQRCDPYTRAQDYTIKEEKAGVITETIVKGRRCGADRCALSRNEVLRTDGLCEACEPYLRAQADGITCKRMTCQYNEVL